MRTHDFRQSVIVGQVGEEIIKNYLKSLSTVSEVIDVTHQTAYRNKDIDLLIKYKNRDCTAEIKTDTYTSGNIFFETMSNLERNVPGCMYKTEADILLYYFIPTKELYIINMKEYRSWFEENIQHFSRKEFKNINRQRNGTYTSVGYTIPKKFLEENFKSYKKVII